MFWIAATVITLACLAIVLAALRTPPPAEARSDVAVYRDQLRELERDVARGTLTEDEAQSARAEVGRRLLSADAATTAPRRTGATVLAAGVITVIVLGVAFGTYRLIGAPGYPDLPLASRVASVEAARAERPGQELAEAEIPDQSPPADADPETLRMAEQLREVLVDRPDDLRGWRLRARIESGLNDPKAAWRAQNRVVAIRGDEADARDFAYLAELMIIAAGGYVSPEAEEVLAETLRLDPSNGSARYYTGLMFAQGGRPDLTWPIWRRLVGDSAEDAPWLPAIYGQIERVSQLAGDPTPLDALPRPGTARGPSAADVQAAGDMTLDERMEMIGGMVEGLAARLATDGGSPSDWGRLITAYGVLGRLNDAATVYAEAQQVFGDDQGAMDIIARAADQAGLAP